MPTSNTCLSDDKLEKMIDYIKNKEREKFLDGIKPLKGLFDSLNIDENGMYEYIYKDEIEEIISEINLKIRGIDTRIGKKIPYDERIYLAGMLYLKKQLSKDIVISSFVYELLRSANLITDEDKRRRSIVAGNILDRLMEKGLIKKMKVDDNIEQFSAPKIIYIYSLNNGQFNSSIEKFPEYKILLDKKQKIVHDTRLFDTIRKYSNALELIKERTMGV